MPLTVPTWTAPFGAGVTVTKSVPSPRASTTHPAAHLVHTAASTPFSPTAPASILPGRGTTEAFPLTVPEYLGPALMPGDTARIPPEGGITWDAPKGPQPIWSQAWFRDAASVHWTVTSKGEIIERPGPPLIIGLQG